MNIEDNKFKEFDALMAYLNESDNQNTTDEILLSPEGCDQIECLQRDMIAIENKISDYEIDENYGVELWNKISDKLESQPKQNWLQKLFRNIQQSNFSAIGLTGVLAIAATFYLLGNNQAVVDTELPQVSSQNLLAQNMQLHLAQTSMFLTQVSNMSSEQKSPVLIETAESLLASNRIYKSAYMNNDNKRLKNLLTELEQVLLEVSNGESMHSQKYISDYANNKLLYKVKSNNQKLKSELINQKQSTSI